MANPTYKINLDDYFDQPLEQDERLQFGQAVIDLISKRTREQNVDKSSRPLHRYSNKYINSLVFKAFDKSPKDVNMTLTGAMLDTLDIVSSNQKQIVFGWNDETENLKAFNHTTGDTVPRRDFLGLPEKEVQRLADDFSSKLERKQTESFTERALAFLKFIQNGEG